MNRRVCVITGSRAEYGLLRWVMEGIRDSESLDLQVVATGMHLAPEFGSTYLEIERDGFVIDRKVEMLVSSDTATGVTKSMGLALIGFADALADLAPNLVLLLGDRFESFCAATAAMMARIPIAHLHGGETTEGAVDEAMRHAMTKMAHLHFVAADPYRRRVIQLGEHPDRVFVVGGLGVDALQRLELMDRPELEASLGIALGARSLLITLHPATLEPGQAEAQLGELLAALADLVDTTLIFTMPNADTEGWRLRAMIDRFVDDHPNAVAFTSLGQRRYLSCVRHVDAVVGNSSSGLAEAPTFHTATINVGSRQQGRLRADSVIDCEPDRLAIRAALARLETPSFQARVAKATNPYGRGGASAATVALLESTSFEGLLHKRFHDLRTP